MKTFKCTECNERFAIQAVGLVSCSADYIGFVIPIGSHNLLPICPYCNHITNDVANIAFKMGYLTIKLK